MSNISTTATIGQEVPAAACCRRNRWLRRGVVLVALVLLFLFRHPLMSLAAKLWIVSDPLEKADAVLVLGGGLDSRPFLAAELYLRGLAPVVLVAEPQKSPMVEMNLMPSDADVSTGILRKLGVPDSAVQRFGGGVTSTRDEASGACEWVKAHNAKRIIIPTDPFHTRRVHIIFGHALQGTGARAIVACTPKRYDPVEWWKSEEATISFQNEVIKLVYYWLH